MGRAGLHPRRRHADAGGARRLPAGPPGLTETQLWERFAAATRGEGEPAVPARTVLPTMALLDAARESGRSGVAVELPEAVEWLL